MKQNLISVCVPIYRSDQFDEAASSIINQDSKGFELVISNDGPSDKPKQLLSPFSSQLKYTHNKPRLGEIKNTNQAINRASGRYICLFHDDDYLEKSFISTIAPLLESDGEIDMIYTGRVMVNENWEVITRQLMHDDRKIIFYQASDILNHLLLGRHISDYSVPIMTPGLIFKRELFNKVGGFDESVNTHIDIDFIYKILALSKKVVYVNEPLYKSRVWHGLSGRTKSSENGTVFFAIKDILDNFIIFGEKNNVKLFADKRIELYDKYADDCLTFNSPLIWIRLRFVGNYSTLMHALWDTTIAIVKLRRKTLLYPKFYIVILVAFLIPKPFLKIGQKLFLKYYLYKN